MRLYLVLIILIVISFGTLIYFTNFKEQYSQSSVKLTGRDMGGFKLRYYDPSLSGSENYNWCKSQQIPKNLCAIMKKCDKPGSVPQFGCSMSCNSTSCQGAGSVLPYVINPCNAPWWNYYGLNYGKYFKCMNDHLGGIEIDGGSGDSRTLFNNIMELTCDNCKMVKPL